MKKFYHRKRKKKVCKSLENRLIQRLRKEVGFKFSRNDFKLQLIKRLGHEHRHKNKKDLIIMYLRTTSSNGSSKPVSVDNQTLYSSKEWRDIRQMVFGIFGETCLCCGSTEDVQVDHVVPRSADPTLALKIKNLQPLCKKCNTEKGVRVKDYRQNMMTEVQETGEFI